MKQLQGQRISQRWLAVLLAVCLLLGVLPVCADGNNQLTSEEAAGNEAESPQPPTKYLEYEKAYKDEASPQQTVFLSASQSDGTVEPFNGKDAFYLDQNTQAVSWQVHVPESGLYRMNLEYFPVEGRSKPVELSLEIDKKTPFEACSHLLFGRVWKNNTESFRTDDKGNQIRPTQVEQAGWLKADVADRDVSGRIYRFYLEKGSHTVSLKAMDEPLRVASLTLYNPADVSRYADAKPAQSAVDATPSYVKTVEAELAVRKSDATLYPSTDRSDPITQPYDPAKTQLNTIGGANWATAGQWVEWDVSVPTDGYYKLTLRARQNIMRGMKSYRRLTIDGLVPYQECEAYGLPTTPSGRLWKSAAKTSHCIFI